MVRRAAHRLVAAAATLMLGALTGFASTPAEEQPPTYTNPVMSGVADAFSDVSLVRAKDGFWYAYATNTILTKENQQEGGSNYLLPIVRTPDLVHWEFVGETFSQDNHPEWAGFPAGGYWAPEVRYVDGRYLMYYSVPNASDRGAAIGVATAAHPGGPWRDAGEPVVDFFTDDVVMEIDPALFIDDDGVKYLYFGSFRTQGIQVVRLSEDGTQAVGEPTQVVAGSRGEAPWVVKRDGYFYLFYSGFGCCNSGGYPVFVGRATSPTGPFLDADGIALTAEHPGGTIVNAPNGNNLIATGHNAVVTDRAGQDWNLTNAKERDDPEWGGRPPAMDRLDWIDGWPTVRAGAWSSDTPQRGPQGSWDAGSTFNDGSTHGWTSVGPGRWHLPADPDSGRHLAARTAVPRDLFMLLDETGPADYRAEADVRIDGNRAVGPRAGRVGLVIGYQDEHNHVIAWLDPAEHALVVQATVEGDIALRASEELHTGFSFTTWSAVSVQVRGVHAAVEVSHAMDNNPLARLEIDLPVELAGGAHVGVVSNGGGQADNVGVTALHEPVTERVPEPEVGALLPEYGDDFEGQDLDAAWHTEHGDVDAELIDESLVWDTQAGNLQTGNPAGVLLRDAPVGTYTVETRVTLPFGPGAHQHPRAGLIAWTSAMDSLHLALTSTGSVRQAFLWPGDAPGPRAGDPEAIHMGPSAETMWLRMRHSIDPVTGEHRYQGATSVDGQTWRWGAVWFLPASQTPPRIGLASMGGAGFTATFDYVRVYGNQAPADPNRDGEEL